MICEILTIGTEILLGDILNSNSQYLSEQLAKLGIDVYKHTSVGDNEERILLALDEAYKKSDLVITSGGLGPTTDDLTKEVCAKFFNKKLIIHEESLQKINEFFYRLKGDFPKSNEKQAYYIDGSMVIPNNNGTAPGLIYEDNGSNKKLIILPGPPRELKLMFEESIYPYLKNFSKYIIVSKMLKTCSLGESKMACLVEDIILNSKNPTVAPYAKTGESLLRVTAKGESEDECLKIMTPTIEKIRQKLGISIYGEDNDTIQSVVAKLLIERNLSISIAESCTGGKISSMLVEIPGISKVFLEGITVYSNRAKLKTLGVKPETLEKYGAVSEECAIEMAEGVAKYTGSNLSISTTGIAGPDGGSKDKPVGLVYIGLYLNGKTKVFNLNYSRSRLDVINRTSMFALNCLREELLLK